MDSRLFEKKEDLPCILLLDSAKAHRAQNIFAAVRKVRVMDSIMHVHPEQQEDNRLGGVILEEEDIDHHAIILL